MHFETTVTIRHDLERLGEILQQAAIQAGATAMAARRSGSFTIGFKGENDPVTSADRATEEEVMNFIRSRDPQAQFLAEETQSSCPMEQLLGPIYVLDPIDGTVNFVSGIPHYAVSLAYAERGEVLAAVVHAPELGETYTAIKEGGAFLNGRPISVRTVPSLKYALVATGLAEARTGDEEALARFARVLQATGDIRRFGSAALDLCRVAQGSLDGYCESVNPWDCAAGRLIASEAGAKIGRFLGDDVTEQVPSGLSGRGLLAASPAVFQELLETLREAPTRDAEA